MAALLHADWSVAEGSVCHRLEPGTACVPEFCDTASYDLWRGADDGLAAPASILWGAFDKIQGRIYVISELFQSGMCPRRWAAV